MGDIFGVLLGLIIDLWHVVGDIYQPFYDFIVFASGKILPVLTEVATFIITGIAGIIETIKNIGDFFAHPFDTIGNWIFGSDPGGGSRPT